MPEIWSRSEVFVERARDGLEVTHALLEAGVTITDRSYIAFEDETGYHHYAFDLAAHHPYA